MHNKEDTINSYKLMKLSTYVTVCGVFIIIIAKSIGWFLTGSVTILASLVDALLDIFISIMNLLAVHYAIQPPDHEHRFGHGKAEDIAVFSESVFLGLSGIIVIFTAINRFFSPHNNVLETGNIGVYVLIFSIIITLIIVLIQKYTIKRSNSKIIEADSLHYFSDLLTNICAIIGILLTTYYHMPEFDNIVAILISVYIIFGAIKLFKRSFKNLMDHELDEKDRQMIIDIIKKNKDISGFHDFKTRLSGSKTFVQLHLELDGNMPIKQTHKIAMAIEQDILAKIPNAEIIIHQDPEGVEEEISYKD